MAQCKLCNSFLQESAPKWVKYCTPCFKKVKQQELHSIRTELGEARAILEGLCENGMIKKLLFLCHPDKHDNSPMSNEVTRFILRLREQLTDGENQ
jgi:hypothetical protein